LKKHASGYEKKRPKTIAKGALESLGKLTEGGKLHRESQLTGGKKKKKGERKTPMT